MSALAPIMEGFFTQRLIGQRRASPHTVASYRDTFRLLLAFVERRTGKAPSKLDLVDLDAVLIGAFLDHLEAQRRNSARTRNTRLAAIRSLFAYAALRHPEHATLIQGVLAIPAKRTDRPLVSFLTGESNGRTGWAVSLTTTVFNQRSTRRFGSVSSRNNRRGIEYRSWMR